MKNMKKKIIMIMTLLSSIVLYANKPNVVLIYADDMGYGDVSYGDKNAKIQTPNIDSLARSGMIFTDGHSSSGICTPSRFAMLTGQHHWRRFHNIVGGFGESVFNKDDFTMANMFKAKGYKTAMVGKWHLGWNWEALEVPEYKNNLKERKKAQKLNKKKGADISKYYPEDLDWSKKIPMGPTSLGFDYYFGDGTINFPPYCWIENDKVLKVPTAMVSQKEHLLKYRKEGGGSLRAGPVSDDWGIAKVLPKLTEKALEFLDKQNDKESFFLYLALNSPHAPIVPNEEYIGKSKAGFYGDFVVQTDDVLAKVINKLEEKGLRDNTIIIFTADNGSEYFLYERQKKFGHWSSGPFRGAKRDLFEGGHHIPFVISWKNHIKENSKCEQVISQVDIFATIADIIGYDLSKNQAIDSYNFSPVLLGKNCDKNIREATVQNTNPNKYALRKGDWVFINAKSGSYYGDSKKFPEYIPSNQKAKNENTPALLYNLKEDVAQVNNLYSKYPEKVKEMKALLDEYVAGRPCAPHAQ